MGESNAQKTAIYISGPVGKIPAGEPGNSIADVIGVEIHLNLFIFSGNLKGFSKGLFTLGAMTGEFIKVIKAFQKQIVGSSVPDGRVDPNGKTLKFLNGPLDARGGKAEPDKIEIPPDVNAAREKIASVAKDLHRQGGHFLIGCLGDTPGRADGHPLRPASASPGTFLDLDHHTRLGPSVLSAWTGHSKHGFLGCMGRPAHLPGSFEDGIVREGDPRLFFIRPYMSLIRRMRIAGLAPKQWPSFPSYLKGMKEYDGASTQAEFLKVIELDGGKWGSAEFPRRINADGFIHLGESCLDRRHYDCIGFVNFVLSKVLRPKWKQTMEYYTTASSKDIFKIQRFDKSADIVAMAQPGDIVAKDINDSHIGICTPANGHVAVTNCRSMKDGLIVSKLGPEWHFLARLQSL